MGLIVAIVVQKIFITLLNLLMVKLPKTKKHKIEDAELGLNKNPDKKKKAEPKYKEYISFKMSPCDKMAFSLGFFLIFTAIAGSIFFSIMKSQTINKTENGTWAGMFFTLLVVDLVVFEFVCIFFSVSLLKKVGSHPTALGRLRNIVIKYGPRAIRSAKVTHGEKPKPKKKKKGEDEEKGAGDKKKSSSKDKKTTGTAAPPKSEKASKGKKEAIVEEAKTPQTEATKNSTAAAKSSAANKTPITPEITNAKTKKSKKP